MMVPKTTKCVRRVTQGTLLIISFAIGCKSPQPVESPKPVPDVSPASALPSATGLKLGASQIEPMYQELLAIDMEAVVRIAQVENADILLARHNVEVRRGQMESQVGALFPALVPSIFFQDIQGTKQATEGDLVGVGFNTFQPGIAIQWILNPGKVYYDIIAAKKRLAASEYQEQSVVMKTLRRGAAQYYSLVLVQAEVEAAQQGVLESQEMLRISQRREDTGSGVASDVLSAQAHLAGRQQVLARAINAFYNASVDLAMTLRLDASVTLVPKIENLSPITLVRDDLDLDALLELAVVHRPDLEQVRLLVLSVSAATEATWWGAYGPEFQAGYSYDGIKTNEGRNSELNDQRRFTAGAGWRWSVSSFGTLKSAHAMEKQAMIEADVKLDEVRSEVIRALQETRMHLDLIAQADQQLSAAQEAFRLTQVRFDNGMTTQFEVLQSQQTGAQARLHFTEAVVHYNRSQVDLLASLGLLDPEKLTPGAT